MMQKSELPNKMPILFVGHGSPENVINENSWSESLTLLGKKLNRTKAIVMISAHWMSSQLKISASAQPDLIYDFYGFPQQLYSVQYPCAGSPELAHRIETLVPEFKPVLDHTHGYDHGAWAPLVHMFPKAQIPVVQISLCSKFKNDDYFKLGQALRPLRNEGILMIGSGNIVHNLRELKTITHPPLQFAQNFDEYVRSAVSHRHFDHLVQIHPNLQNNFEQSHPIPDHYWPLLVCAGAVVDDDLVSYPYEGFQYGSISMRNILWE